MIELELQIERLSHGAEGIARDPQGRVVFVTGALPGERVLARVHTQKRRFARAQAVQIIEPSPWRVEPGCPHAHQCGGCQLWHLDQRQELSLKAQAACEAIARVGRLEVPLPDPILHQSPSSERYRCRATFHLRGVAGKERLVGFHEEQSHRILSLSQCPVVALPLERAYEELSWALPSLVDAELLCELATEAHVVVTVWAERWPASFAQEAQQWLARSKVVRGVELRRPGLEPLRFGQPQIPVEVAMASTPASIRGGVVPAGLFRQANPEINQAMAQTLLELVTKASAQDMIELFCGYGNFSFALAAQLKRLRAFEGQGQSVEAAVELAQHHPHDGLTFEVADLMGEGAKRWFEQIDLTGVDALLLDPPRAGARELCQLLAQAPSTLKDLFYISCDPACLGRDLGELGQGWRMEQLHMFEMFPRTAHLEALVWLRRA